MNPTQQYWRCSRILRGHSYGTPIIAELKLSAIARETDNPRLRRLAQENAMSRWRATG